MENKEIIEISNKINNEELYEEDYDEENEEIEIKSYSKQEIPLQLQERATEDINRLMNKKRIIINSDYQRNFVWTNLQQCRLIDSIFLGIPIPSIWLIKRKNGIFEIIDGLQRLTTIKNFMDNKLQLKNMTWVEKLNNKTYTELEETFKFDFNDYNIRLTIINDNDNNDKNLVYELFKRINQNSAPLQKQELRNATYISKFNDEIKNLAKNDKLISEILPNKKYGARMKNIEMFYRFLGQFSKYDSQKNQINNSDSIDNTVTSFMNKAITFKEEEIKYYINELKEAILKVYTVFNTKSFRKWENKKFKEAINVPLMEMQLITLYKYDKNYLNKNKNQIIEKFKELFKDDEFNYSLRAATSSSSNINIRLQKFQNKLNELK